MKKELFGMKQRPAPSRCPDCSARLQKAVYKTPPITHYRGNAYFKLCDCGCFLLWVFPQLWIRRHVLPLFDMDRIVVQDAS